MPFHCSKLVSGLYSNWREIRHVICLSKLLLFHRVQYCVLWVSVCRFVDMSEKQQDFIARTTSILRNALTELESSAVSNANVTQSSLPSNSPSTAESSSSSSSSRASENFRSVLALKASNLNNQEKYIILHEFLGL